MDTVVWLGMASVNVCQSRQTGPPATFLSVAFGAWPSDRYSGSAAATSSLNVRINPATTAGS